MSRRSAGAAASLLNTTPSKITEKICQIFSEAQSSKAGHRRLFAIMRRLHHSAVQCNLDTDFNKALVMCLNRVLAAKFNTSAIERLLDFIPGYIAFSKEKDIHEFREQRSLEKRAQVSDNVTPDDTNVSMGAEVQDKSPATADDEEEENPDTCFSLEFAVWLIRYLLNGVGAKDKFVRHRCVKLIYHISSHLSSIDESLFSSMKKELLSRLRDKEVILRRDAVNAISNLQAAEAEDEEETVSSHLIRSMNEDPAPAVRRAAIQQVESSKASIAAIVSRCTDSDSSARKAAFKQLETRFESFSNIHPTYTAVALDCGLKDPDESVKLVCSDLLDSWIQQSVQSFVELLAQINVIENRKVGENIIFDTLRRHPQFYKKFIFNDKYWRQLTPETAMILRCVAQKVPDFADNLHVDSLGYYLQYHTNKMLLNRDESLDPLYHAIVNDLLLTCLTADYSDALGRQKMFTLVRSMIASLDILEDFLDPQMELLRMLCVDERDFIRVVNEIITDLRDEDVVTGRTAAEGASGHADQGDGDSDEIFRDYRCLLMLRKTLIATDLGWRNNAFAPMHGLLPELVIPAFEKYSSYAQVLGFAVECLGLICLTSVEHARRFFPQFVGYAALNCTGDSTAQLDVVLASLRAAFDLLYIFSIDALKVIPLVLETFYDVAQAAIMSPVKSIALLAAVGCSRLYLVKKLMSKEILRNLLTQYLSPTSSHQDCLEYFVGAFVESFDDHKIQIAEVFPSVIKQLCSPTIHCDPQRLTGQAQKLLSIIASAEDKKWQLKAAKELMGFVETVDDIYARSIAVIVMRLDLTAATTSDIRELKELVLDAGEAGLPDSMSRSLFAKFKELAPSKNKSLSRSSSESVLSDDKSSAVSDSEITDAGAEDGPRRKIPSRTVGAQPEPERPPRILTPMKKIKIFVQKSKLANEIDGEETSDDSSIRFEPSTDDQSETETESTSEDDEDSRTPTKF